MADSRKITILAFLLSIFIFLGVFLGAWIYRTYHEQTGYSKEESTRIMECTDYSFRITHSEYRDGKLRIELDASASTKDIPSLTIQINEEKHLLEETLYAGLKGYFELEATINQEKIIIYPTGCQNLAREIIPWNKKKEKYGYQHYYSYY